MFYKAGLSFYQPVASDHSGTVQAYIIIYKLHLFYTNVTLTSDYNAFMYNNQKRATTWIFINRNMNSNELNCNWNQVAAHLFTLTV